MLDKVFDAKSIEEKYYKRWEESGIFACNPDSNKKPYTIPMPPPNVTGSLHMGHALTMTLQDILTRYRRMQGDDMLWQPGTDHAGIATQMVVERQLDEQGISRHDLGREKFLEKVWEWKEKSGNTITKQLRKLGATPDWERERFTMDVDLSKAVKKVFVQLYNEELIYKDKRLVNWDPKLHTAISDLEVEQKETKSHMWHFKYPLAGDSSKFIIVATTRPETILGDTGIAVHPDDERYKDLVGEKAILPIVNREIPIVADEYADPEQGSGAVKITPAHDFNDFEVGKRCNLDIINIFDRDARLNENVPEKYRGLDRFKARDTIVAEMEELGLLEKVEEHVYQLPYGDRSGVVIEPFLTDQWYCDAVTLAKPAIEAVESGKTEFVPKNWEKTYFEWMRNIQPWCISRQLWWGHRIPAWYDKEGNIFVAESLAEAQKQAGEDVELTQDEDVLDTWFSSALWPFSTLGWPDKTKELDKYYPADVLITGFDIIFFWVARMMMMGLHFMGDVPFKKVYIHALVRDEHGQKMSKSKGNIVDPLDTIEKYGADALRFTLTALAAQGRDIKLSESRIEGYRNFATKLWNVARYCEMNECKPKEGFSPADLKLTVNRWIVSEVAKLSQDCAKALDNFRFNEAANLIYQFAWGSFCDWYIEITKPVLNGDDEEAKAETRATAAFVFDDILLMLNPIMPYITEELRAHLHDKDPNATTKEDWLISANWPKFDDNVVDKGAVEEIELIVRLITTIRSVRADMNVPPSAFINMQLKDASDRLKQVVEENSDIIKRLARLDSIEFTNADAPKGSIQAVIDEATIILPIADVIDINAEKERLQKEIKKISDDIAKIEKKLSNENFLNKAPKEVVEEQKNRKAEAEKIKEKLSSALNQLEEVA